MDRLAKMEAAVIAQTTEAIRRGRDIPAWKISGLSGSALSNAWAACALVGLAWAVFNDEGRFGLSAPDTQIGPNALIVGALEADAATTADLVAIDLYDHDRWAVAFGSGPILGRQNLVPAAFFDGPLAIHRGPIQWLRAGCRGIVVLQRNDAALDALASADGPFLAPDEAFGREMVDWFARPRIDLGRVLVRRPGREAA
ncbi:MAG: hypothetical protein K2X45_04905 [Phreatobacter sp.]|nr:hypothetical protein [Phreatobacter sp.]